jgi:hypothetical protein
MDSFLSPLHSQMLNEMDFKKLKQRAGMICSDKADNFELSYKKLTEFLRG